MTRNNHLKKQIRTRMEETGEKYNVARREIELSNITVWELGENGGHWFIENTDNEQLALLGLKNWMLSTDPDALEYYEPFAKRLALTYREDWYWKPLNPQYPNDESVLMSKQEDIENTIRETFKGFYITEK